MRYWILLAMLLPAVYSLAQPPTDVLRYEVPYKCDGETVQVKYCRKDSDRPGFSPTKPQDNYCLVYYPDRPKSGGFIVQESELRDDITKKLQACGALPKEDSVNTQPSSPADTRQ